MANTVTRFSFSLKAVFVCLLLFASVCSADVFDSLQFTRDALFGFSPDSTSKESAEAFSASSNEPEQPLNKNLAISSEIEKAMVNAKSMDTWPRKESFEARYEALGRLFANSIKSNSYSYARDVLGKILHLVETDSKKRRKRSPENVGKLFLQELMKTIGKEKIDSFMAVKGGVSLMFVIDDTGSMSSEIEAVKKIAIAVVNYTRGKEVEYILSPFNDPMKEAAQVVVKDYDKAEEFIQAISNLVAASGGDCPEYTLQGIRNALEQAQHYFLYGSSMYVFTDADPKDADDNNMGLVKHLAIDEKVKINIFSTGSCKNGLHPAFLDLSKHTSGEALLFKNKREMEKLKKVMGEALKGTTIISFGLSLLGRRKRSSDSLYQYSFPVDDSMETMTIILKTTRNTTGDGITLRYPNGTICAAEKLTLSILSVYQITKPAKGNWTLEILEETTGEFEFHVESSSQTNIDFNLFFMISLGRRKVEVPSITPIAGKLNKMVLTLLAGEEQVNTTSLRLQMVNPSGSVICSLDLLPRGSKHYEASFSTPTTPFRLKLLGTTHQGHPFERVSHYRIKPTTALLRGKYASNDFTLPLNVTTFLHFQICNFGASERFEIVSRNDTLGYILQPRAGSQRPKYVGKDRCTTIFLMAKATRLADVGKADFVFLKAKGQSSGVDISGHIRLLVDNHEA